MTRAARRDEVAFVRARHVPEVELVSVAYRNRVFPEHAHDEYVIGAVTAGAELLAVGGKTWLAAPGSVLRLHPREVHANATHGSQTLRYSVLYIPRATLLRYRNGAGEPHFETPVTRHPRLHRQVRETHAILSSPNAGKAEQEKALAALACLIGTRSTGLHSKKSSPPSEAADAARRYIDDHLFENFGLSDLCGVTRLSPSHLVRIFKKVTGLSPLAYRNQRRIFVARQRLIDGQPTAELALNLGYADQSHFTRHFQRLIGVSPQRYARGIGMDSPGRG